MAVVIIHCRLLAVEATKIRSSANAKALNRSSPMRTPISEGRILKSLSMIKLKITRDKVPLFNSTQRFEIDRFPALTAQMGKATVVYIYDTANHGLW